MTPLSNQCSVVLCTIMLFAAFQLTSQETPDGFISNGVFYHRPQPLSAPGPETYGYKKPEMLAKECIASAEKIRIHQEIEYREEEALGKSRGRLCIGCEPVQQCCPGDAGCAVDDGLFCQGMIDSLYLACGGSSLEDDGVTLPDGYYFDPKRTVDGTWNMEAKQSLRIAIGRCGCSDAPSLYNFLPSTIIYVIVLAGIIGADYFL